MKVGIIRYAQKDCADYLLLVYAPLIRNILLLQVNNTEFVKVLTVQEYLAIILFINLDLLFLIKLSNS